jgi:hypothetical protein
MTDIGFARRSASALLDLDFGCEASAATKLAGSKTAKSIVHLADYRLS